MNFNNLFDRDIKQIAKFVYAVPFSEESEQAKYFIEDVIFDDNVKSYSEEDAYRALKAFIYKMETPNKYD